MKDKVPKKTTVSVKFSREMFSLLDFYTTEDGTRLIGHPKMPERRYHSKLCNISEEWRSHMMIWRCRPWFGSTWSGSEQSDLALHTKIKMSHI
jgi:hypothetical protein